MIRQLVVGIARVTFGAAILVFMFGIGLAYLAYRAIRWAIRGDKPYPVRDAAFGLMVASAVMAKAIKAEQDRRDADAARRQRGSRSADLEEAYDDGE